MTHPILADLRADDPATRRSACAAVASDPSAVLLVDALCEALGDPDPSVARAASRALASLGAHRDAVRTALASALRSEQPERRMRAALTYAHLEPPPIKLLPPLVEALGHAEGDERWQVTRALVELGRMHGEVLPVLAALVETGASPRVQRMALLALRALAPDRPETLRAVLEASRSPDLALRRVALSACAGLMEPPAEIAERLAEALASDPDAASRRSAAAALRALAAHTRLPDAALGALERAASARDDDESVREHAARALTQFRAPMTRGTRGQAPDQKTRASKE